MIGSLICDICGRTYHKDGNKSYDGLMVWCYDEDENKMYYGTRAYNIIAPDGKMLKNVPEMMDICPDCLKKFCNWIKTIKEETK